MFKVWEKEIMPSGYYLRTEYHKERLRGRKMPIMSIAHKKKIGQATSIRLQKFFKNGGVIYNKTFNYLKCLFCNKEFRVKPCKLKNTKYCSLECRNKSYLGRKISEEYKLILSERQRGEKSHFWKGGKTKLSQLIRTSAKYKNWRTSVFERDNYTCQECGVKNVYLQAHHIKPFAYYSEYRFELLNGITLCRDCHRKTDTYGSRSFNYAIS